MRYLKFFLLLFPVIFFIPLVTGYNASSSSYKAVFFYGDMIGNYSSENYTLWQASAPLSENLTSNATSTNFSYAGMGIVRAFAEIEEIVVEAVMPIKVSVVSGTPRLDMTGKASWKWYNVTELIVEKISIFAVNLYYLLAWMSENIMITITSVIGFSSIGVFLAILLFISCILFFVLTKKSKTS